MDRERMTIGNNDRRKEEEGRKESKIERLKERKKGKKLTNSLV
jgi:hypothetical protein